MIYYKIHIKYKQYECFFFGPNNYKCHADLKKTQSFLLDRITVSHLVYDENIPIEPFHCHRLAGV